jgi:hypothetical protein
MRHTMLSRSVIAVASLAVGSAAFAAVPATAASAAGVTREQVLTAVDGVRNASNTQPQYSPATVRAMRAIVVAGCDAGDTIPYLDSVKAVTTSDDADGLIITAQIETFSNDYLCTVGAFATTDTSSTLSGTAKISGTVENLDYRDSEVITTTTPIDQTSALSGDAYLTPAITTQYGQFGPTTVRLDASATGTATKTTTTTTNVKVTDKKSAKEKKAAKKKFSKRLAQAKKNYAKALDKAGSSKNKKAAAKRVYAKARALAKAKYAADVSSVKIVQRRSTTSEARAFDITTATPAPAPTDSRVLLG